MADDYAGDVTTTGVLTDGASATGVLDTTNDSDWFRFVSVGGTYVVRSTTYQVGVYDQGGALVAATSGSSGFPFIVRIPAGTFFVGVVGVPNGGAPFSYMVSEYKAQAPIFYTTDNVASVSRLSGNPVAYLYAEPATSSPVSYAISGGAEASSFMVASSASSASGQGLYLKGTPTPGTYHVTVQASEAGAQPSTSNYTVNVFDDDFGDTTATGGQIAVGQTVNARFNAANLADTDAFNTFLEKNAVYALTLSGVTNAPVSVTYAGSGYSSGTLYSGASYYIDTSYDSGNSLIAVRSETISDYALSLKLLEHIPQITSSGGTYAAPLSVKPGQIVETVAYTSDAGQAVSISINPNYNDFASFSFDSTSNTLRLNANVSTLGGINHDGLYQVTLIIRGAVSSSQQNVYVKVDAPPSVVTVPPEPPKPPSVLAGLSTEIKNLARVTVGDSALLSPSSSLSKLIAAGQQLAVKLDVGTVGLLDTQNAIYHLVDGTTSVAELSYAFFVGRTPSAQGLSYLVNSNANASDLNDTYYQTFSTENRYINFAVGLASGSGAGATAFRAQYSALSLTDATEKAYTQVFGFGPATAKVAELLTALVPDGRGGTETRAQYFADIGDGTPLGQKAAMIGFLLADSVKEGFGAYQQANLHFLQDLAHGTAVFNVDLLGAYVATPTLVGAPVPDMSLGG